MGSQVEIVTNLSSLLELFVEENFASTNNVYFEKLITHLAAKDKAGLLQTPFVLEWVDRCLTILVEDFSKLNPKVIAFAFNLFSLLLKNEWNILEIRKRRMGDRLVEIIKRESHKFNPSIKLSVIRLLNAISQYSLGIAHLVSVKIWQFIIEYCNQDHTLYVVREARSLLYDFLYKYDVKTKDIEVVKEILGEIMKPLTENVYDCNNDKIMVNVEDHDLQHKLSATLDLLSFIFQETLESKEKTNIATICQLEQKIELTVWKLTDMYYNENFILKVLTTLSSYYYAKFVADKWNEDGQQQIDAHNFNELGVKLYNQMKFCIQRNYAVNFLKIAGIIHKLWKKMGPRVPKQIYIENELVRFESQLIVFQIVPLHMILRIKEFEEEELFEKYLTKIFDMVCEQTLRMLYTYRDTTINMPTPTSVDLSLKSVNGVMSMVDILERDEAVIVFQACIYAFKEFIIKLYQCDYRICMDPSFSLDDLPSFSIIAEYSTTIHAILVSIQTLVERFELTWKDSMETLCLVNCTLQLLLAEDLPVKVILELYQVLNAKKAVTVQSLKLLQLSIEHFLSPNMALLVDNLQGSGLTVMAPIIKKRSHDPNWEVRDSILELVMSIASISQIKFPAFQTFLTENWISCIVYDMAKNDTEPYVRASALKCITELVVINGIFDGDPNKQNILEHVFDVIYNETEGIVRKEAILTLVCLTKLRKIPSRYKDTYFSTLTYAIDSDLYWEVRVEAIRCLKFIICNLLKDQGMIDGNFPTVTFSKEKKKIIQLNPAEVNLRFLKVLTELQERGILGVLLKCFREDCDGAVMRAAETLIQVMINKMAEHNYVHSPSKTEPTTSSNIPSTTANSNQVNPFLAHISTTDEVNKIETSELVSGDAEALQFLDSDDIIENILNSQDINLLAETYKENLNISDGSSGNSEHSSTNSPQDASNERRQIDQFYYKKFRNVGNDDFIDTIMSIDFAEKSCQEDQWFLCDENFVQLLNEILCVIKPEADSESISADCY